MSSRQPYHGPHRKLVLAFDVGTTYSGVSYSILDPGLVPEIQGVTRCAIQVISDERCLNMPHCRYPAQQKVGGDSKIPSVIYYDKEGKVRAVGAEALQESLLEQAEDEEWIKVEWYLADI
jgi:molecular chaperone DnaK (HSP70)